MDEWKSMVIHDSGVKLAYLDSGAPNVHPYATIFALHGLQMSSTIFLKTSSLAKSKGIRIVAINRRGYPGSTPYTTAEVAIAFRGAGTDDDKAQFLVERGLEVLHFVDKFIEHHDLPACSDHGTQGGVGITGWSMGSTSGLAAISSFDCLPDKIQERLAPYLRCLILLEPPLAGIGAPPPPEAWCPLWDHEVPAAKRVQMFVQWASGYFQYRTDISTRDPGVYSNIVPSNLRTPTVFTMSAEDQEKIFATSRDTFPDVTFPTFCEKQIATSYSKACFNRSLRSKLPLLDIWEVTGDSSCWLCIVPSWKMKDDDKAAGGGFVNFMTVRGVNHFMIWDSPKETVDAFLRILCSSSRSNL